jgi:hypothetical protein
VLEGADTCCTLLTGRIIIVAKFSKRTRLALAPRSTKQAAIPPGSAPDFPADLGSGTPPAKDRAQRRFDRLIVGLTLLLVAALIAGLVGYTHVHDRAAARARLRRDAAQRVADVKQAYLDYYAALGQTDAQLNIAPVQQFVTTGGLKEEQQTLQEVLATGYRYRLSADHDPRVVVYSGDALASVDDNLVRHMTPLDSTTGAPAGPEQTLPIHASYALKLDGGRWLVDSEVTFGSDGSDPKFGLSYAAVERQRPLDQALHDQIQRDYLAYWEARKKAYQNLDPAPMRQAILEPQLDIALSLLSQQQQKKEGFLIQVQHNERIAVKDAGTAYVYDTFVDSGHYFDFATKRPEPSPPIQVLRQTYEMKKVGNTWKVDSVAGITSK